MKKWMSILVAVLLVLSMTAYAAVPSKTTSNATTVVAAQSSTSVELAADFAVAVTADAEPVAKEIEKIFTFVASGNAPVKYFPTAVVEQIAAKLPETVAVEAVEINEYVSIDQSAYTDAYGDVKVSFSFTTNYAPSQTLVALVGIYTGEVDANGEFIVEWIVLDAVVNADGSVEVTFTQDAMLKMQQAKSTSLAIASTAV